MLKGVLDNCKITFMDHIFNYHTLKIQKKNQNICQSGLYTVETAGKEQPPAKEQLLVQVIHAIYVNLNL